MRALRSLIESLFWVIVALISIVGVMLLFGWAAAPALSYIGIFALLTIIPLLVRIVTILRRRRAEAVLTYLEQAVRLNLPLPRMIHAAQKSEEGVLADRLANLSRELLSGRSVASALSASVPEIKPAAVAMIQTGERIGRLPQILHRLTHKRPRDMAPDTPDAAFARVYPFALLVLIMGTLGMIAVFVLPKFETIFKDFGAKLPWITQATFDAFRLFGPIAVFIFAMMLLGWIALMLWRFFDPKWARFETAVKVRDYLAWSTPIAHGIVRDRGLAEALDLMAQALRAGQPIHRAAEEASGLRINEVLRDRFAEWGVNLREGQSIPDAARRAGLPSLVAEMLAPIHVGEQTAEVIEFLSRYYEVRFSRTWLLLRGAAIPAIVLIFGAVVLCVAMAMLTPIATLITNLSSHAIKWRL